LAEQAKDLEVVALMTEALVRRNGLAGLRDGFRLARALCERFWEHLYPRPDEEGVVTLVAPLAGLNGEDADGLLIGPIGKLPITGGTTVGPFSMSDYQTATEADRIEDPAVRARRLEQPGAVSRQMFDAAVAETSPEFVLNLLDDLSQCSEEFESLGKLLEERCGKDERGFSRAPPSSNIRSALRECRESVQTVFRHMLTPDEQMAAEGDEGGGQVVTGAAATSGKAVATREDAFRALLQIADFFKRTEPHSPVSYNLEQAVRWGRMNLPELLEELIPDGGARQNLYKVLGIRPPEG
jgi:type VI secretion system protein ImpA